MNIILRNRIIAYILDMIIFTLSIWILTLILYPIIFNTGTIDIFSYFWIYCYIILVIVYFAFFEYKFSTSLGKHIMSLKVTSISKNGKLNIVQSVIRNISKIFWIPIIFDLIIGYLLKKDTRILDSIAKTKVVLI